MPKMFSLNKIWIVALLPLTVLAGCRRGLSPTQFYEEIGTHTRAGDWGYYYDHTDLTGQKKLDLITAGGLTAIIVSGKTPPKTDGMNSREQFITLMKFDPGSAEEQAVHEEVVSESISGNKATLKVKDKNGEDDVYMVWDDNQWKHTF